MVPMTTAVSMIVALCLIASGMIMVMVVAHDGGGLPNYVRRVCHRGHRMNAWGSMALPMARSVASLERLLDPLSAATVWK